MQKEKINEKLTGLNQGQVNQLLLKYGYNELEDSSTYHNFRNFLKILKDPMGLMLLLLGIIYLSMGNTSDAIVIFIAYLPIVAIDVLLEIRSQKSIRSLRKSIQTTCKVIRNGEIQNIQTKMLVPGDLLLLEEGLTVAADGRLIESTHLTVDESSLTGESVPVEKLINHEVLSGTSIMTGRGILQITKTGLSSQVGNIAKILNDFQETSSPLLKSINKMVKYVVIFALSISALVFINGLIQEIPFAENILIALTLAMAAIPEEFPMVFTLYLSLAAYRLSKRNVLVKSLPSVEGLGSVDVICTDKTGTLTEGNFQLNKIILSENPNKQFSLNEQLLAMIHACETEATDGMEVSMFEWIKHHRGIEYINSVHQEWKLETDYPFDLNDKYMSHVWRNITSGEKVIAMKGSLEGVLKHCNLSQEDKNQMIKMADAEAALGNRLLGLAMKKINIAEKSNREQDEKNLHLVGILSFTDPIRQGAKHAVEKCVESGIKIKMLTGDHLLTAHSIADQLNIPHTHEQLFTGQKLALMDINSRSTSYLNGVIFARLKPEQKLELIKSLQNKQLIVAMAGDGVNDAPALKLADVGISMGERATDVARTTSQIILLKNNFEGIVDAVFEGRRVLQSLKESFGYLIAFHIPIFLLALYQSFFSTKPILFPVHIILLELIVHPISAIVFDRSVKVKTSMQKSFFNTREIIQSALRGVIITIATILIFSSSSDIIQSRTNAVIFLVLSSIGLMMAELGGCWAVLKDFTNNSRFWTATLTLIICSLVMTSFSFMQSIFSLESLNSTTLIILIIAGSSIGLIRTSKTQIN